MPIVCFATQQNSTAPQSCHAQLTQVRLVCSWTLPCVSSLVPSVLHLSHGFQRSPTLNRHTYERRLPLTSWQKKSSNTTDGQSSLIFSTHHFSDRKPLWLDLQPADIKSRWRHNWKLAQVVNSHLVCDPTIRDETQTHCPTLSNLVLWRSWMAACPSCILWMRTPFPG